MIVAHLETKMFVTFGLVDNQGRIVETVDANSSVKAIHDPAAWEALRVELVEMRERLAREVEAKILAAEGKPPQLTAVNAEKEA